MTETVKLKESTGRASLFRLFHYLKELVRLLLLILLIGLFIYMVLPEYYRGDDTLVLREVKKVVNGELKVSYEVDDPNGISLPLKKIHFTKPFYREALKKNLIKDLNVVIPLKDWEITLRGESLELHRPLISRILGTPAEIDGIFLKTYNVYGEIKTDLRGLKETKAVIRSGEVPIGYAPIKVEIERDLRREP